MSLKVIDVKNVDPKNKKTLKTRFLMKIIESVKKTLNKNVDDKYTQLFKPNEKFSSKITVFVCMTTSDSYGSSSENFLYLPC